MQIHFTILGQYFTKTQKVILIEKLPNNQYKEGVRNGMQEQS